MSIKQKRGGEQIKSLGIHIFISVQFSLLTQVAFFFPPHNDEPTEFITPSPFVTPKTHSDPAIELCQYRNNQQLKKEEKIQCQVKPL